jgi:hypothetical protein
MTFAIVDTEHKPSMPLLSLVSPKLLPRLARPLVETKRVHGLSFVCFRRHACALTWARFVTTGHIRTGLSAGTQTVLTLSSTSRVPMPRPLVSMRLPTDWGLCVTMGKGHGLCIDLVRPAPVIQVNNHFRASLALPVSILALSLTSRVPAPRPLLPVCLYSPGKINGLTIATHDAQHAITVPSARPKLCVRNHVRALVASECRGQRALSARHKDACLNVPAKLIAQLLTAQSSVLPVPKPVQTSVPVSPITVQANSRRHCRAFIVQRTVSGRRNRMRIFA